MRFSDLCEKEVVNVKDCRCLGSVRDLDIDKECGKILALIVPGPGKYLGCFCRDSEFFIPWAKVIRIQWRMLHLRISPSSIFCLMSS